MFNTITVIGLSEVPRSCFRYWTIQYDPGRFSEIQRSLKGQRWHGDFNFDFNRQAADVRELKNWGLKQVTIATVVRIVAEPCL